MKIRDLVMICIVAVLALSSLLACTTPATTPTTPTSTAPTTTTPTTMAPSPTESEVITWVGQANTVPPYSLDDFDAVSAQLGFYRWIDWIEQASGGRLVFDVQPPNSLVPDNEAFTAASQGVMQFAQLFGLQYGTKVPEAYIESFLPFALEGPGDAWILWEHYGWKEELRDLYASHNLQYVKQVTSSPMMGIGTTFPTPDSNSLQGKKIRAVGSFADVVAMLGATPANIPFFDTYMALKLGTVDGWFSMLLSLEEMQWNEVTTDIIGNSMGTTQTNIVINMDAFNELPDDLKDLIMSTSDAPTVLGSVETQWFEKYVLAQAESRFGVNVWEWSAEEIATLRKQAIETIWPKLAQASPASQRLIDMAIKFEEDLARVK